MSKQIFIDQFGLAARWGLGVKTLRNWRCRKLGPSYTKIGRKILYRLRDVLTFEETNDVVTRREGDVKE